MKSRRSTCTTLSIVVPLLIVVFGGIATAVQPRQESDWLGLGYILLFLGAVVVAALASLLFSAIAFLRHESRAEVSMIGSVPAVIFLGVAAFYVAGHLYDDYQKEKLDALIAQIVADPVARRELVSQEMVDPDSVRALLSYPVRDLLTPAEVERIWDQCKNVDTGLYYKNLIGPAYTPERVLREYFDRLMAAEVRRSSERPYRRLVDHIEFLHHRNLPQDIIDEILASGEPDVVVQLQRNPRLTSNPLYLRRWADAPPHRSGFQR